MPDWFLRRDVMAVEGSRFDVEAYFGRIGYAGPRAPTLQTLRAIHLLHPQAIPFENLDPFLRRPVNLDPVSLQNKLVRGGRGGYCFEHNLLLREVLQKLGFRVTGLAARVMWNAPEGAIRPRGHMLLRVDLDGVMYLADVGFGGLTLTTPLRLAADVEQSTPHEPFRLIEAEGLFVLEALVRSSWKPLYQFDLQPQLLADYEVSSWYLSNHPQSHFVTGLMVARPDSDRRYGLSNNRLTVHHLHGTSEQLTLASAAELRDTLETVFGIRVPAGPSVDATLARLISA